MRWAAELNKTKKPKMISFELTALIAEFAGKSFSPFKFEVAPASF